MNIFDKNCIDFVFVFVTMLIFHMAIVVSQCDWYVWYVCMINLLLHKPTQRNNLCTKCTKPLALNLSVSVKKATLVKQKNIHISLALTESSTLAGVFYVHAIHLDIRFFI